MQTELVHLVAGPSGAGKTRWLLSTLQNIWRLGKPVLGHKSYPVPWCYVPMDRVYASVETTLLSLNIDPLNINVVPAVDCGYKRIAQVLDHAQRDGAKLVVIDMFAYLIEGPQTSENVRSFMGAVTNMLQNTGMTIIGTMESPKMRPKDAYKNPRQRISGPASWGHCAETVILVENDPRLPENSKQRVIQVLPRNGEHMIYRARFHSNGKLTIDNSRGAGLATEDSEK